MSMSTAFLTCLAAGPLLWIAWLAWRLHQNYQAAKLSGLPILLCPFSPDSIPYLFVKVPLRGFLEKWLPLPGISVSIIGWEAIYKHQVIHEKHGHSFILVSPGRSELWTCDPETAQVILTRRREFPQLIMSKVIMGAFGKNVISSDGDSWSRQRRLVGPNLNERTSEIVWNESRDQAEQMVDYMLKQPDGKSGESVTSIRAIAINVLSQVGYGQPKPFKPLALPRHPSDEMTYVDAVGLIGELIVVAAFISSWILRLSKMPTLLQTLGVALDKLPNLTAKMLKERRQHGYSDNASHAREDFMSMLVRLSDSGKTETETAQHLTEEEIAGNMFLFTVAGFDTTANTLTNAFALLAALPEWQDWIQEEIDYVLGQTESRDYNILFPRLTRCLALMHEILRLYTPLPHVGRNVQEALTLTIGGKAHHIEPMTVYINTAAIHTLPAIWGNDSLEFKPTRWIVKSEDSGPDKLGEEKMLTPQKGAFLPWSGGPRICPGMKMAQVEFVTVMATVFSRCRVEPATNESETLEAARTRFLDIVKDTMLRLTMQVTRPDELVMRFIKR